MNLPGIYLLGVICGGVYEYFCSAFTENVMGVRFWDYSKMPYNIRGVLVLADAVLTLLAIKRYMERKTGKYPQNRVEKYIDHTYPDTRIERLFPHMKVCYQKENVCVMR